MFGWLRRTFHEITESPAGERFRRYHRRRNDNNGLWRTAAFIGAGLLLVIVGLFLSLPPLMPGFLLWIPGLAMIATQLRRVARALDRGECLVRNLYRRVSGSLKR